MADLLTACLRPHAATALQRRAARWQLDTRRARVRLTFAKDGDATDFDEGDLHALFLQAFRLEGLGLVLDLGKRPRPLLSLGLPLPAGVEGKAEYFDVVLKQEPAGATSQVMARLNQRLPLGLRLLAWEGLANCASELTDLALRSHWRWDVLSSQREQIEMKAEAFLQAEAWPWDRGGTKAPAGLDLRRLVLDLEWRDGALCFATPMGLYQAINPVKMLAAIFDLEPMEIRGLVRTDLALNADGRIAQAERFEPKLKNMYEDAVLLGGGSNITLIEEEDEEPLRLG